MRALVATLVAVAAVGLGTHQARAETWSFGAEGGALIANDFASAGRYYPSFGPELLLSLSAERRVQGSLGVRAEAGWFQNSEPVLQPWEKERTDFYLPLGVAFRFHSPAHIGLRTAGFAQVGPSLVIRHVAVTRTWVSGGDITPISQTEYRESSTHLGPGLMAGVGLRTRISDQVATECALRLLFADEVLDAATSARLQSFAFTMGIGWSP